MKRESVVRMTNLRHLPLLGLPKFYKIRTLRLQTVNVQLL